MKMRRQYEEKTPVPFLTGEEEEAYETSVLINDRNNLLHTFPRE